MSKPEKVFKMGAVRASIFRNFVNQGGRSVALPKIVIEVRYKNKAGEWDGTNSLSINDVPKAVAALQQAYEYLLSGDAQVEQEEDPRDDRGFGGGAVSAPAPAQPSWSNAPNLDNKWPSRY